jgi:hypothetical protein
MKIDWDYNNKQWLVYDPDVTTEEMAMLASENLCPEYYDNWDIGDVYMYDKHFPVGMLVDLFNDSEFTLELLY